MKTKKHATGKNISILNGELGAFQFHLHLISNLNPVVFLIAKMKITRHLDPNGIPMIDVETHLVFTDDFACHTNTIGRIDDTPFQFDIVDCIPRKTGRLKVPHGVRQQFNGAGKDKTMFRAFFLHHLDGLFGQKILNGLGLDLIEFAWREVNFLFKEGSGFHGVSTI